MAPLPRIEAHSGDGMPNGPGVVVARLAFTAAIPWNRARVAPRHEIESTPRKQVFSGGQASARSSPASSVAAQYRTVGLFTATTLTSRAVAYSAARSGRGRCARRSQRGVVATDRLEERSAN